jgi:hypothetical protein
MSNSFSKEERVAFDEVLAAFNDELAISRNVTVKRTDDVTMARTNDQMWFPRPYILPSFDGMDQTGNFSGKTQLAVPASITTDKSVPFQLNAKELRDALQENRLGAAARQRLASDINSAVLTTVALNGSLCVKRTVPASGFDDIAQLDAMFSELGVPQSDRCAAFGTRDYNGMASDLQKASRSLGNQISDTALRTGVIPGIIGFDIYKLDNVYRLTAATATGVTINEATAGNRRYVPAATATSGTLTSNVDNRFMQLTVAVTGSTIKVGDRFTITSGGTPIQSVHLITKQPTGQPKTFTVTRIVSGGGGSGVIEFSPPLIAADSTPTQAEVQYKNVDRTPANGASLVFLNTVTANANPFWHKDAVWLVPGRYQPASDSGMAVMRGTTDQGIELVMTKQADIDTFNFKYRFDSRWGVNVMNEEMAGICLFNQT